MNVYTMQTHVHVHARTKVNLHLHKQPNGENWL